MCGCRDLIHSAIVYITDPLLHYPSSSPSSAPPPSLPHPDSSRRTSDPLFTDWTMVEAGRSGDELSGAEDASKDMEDFEKKKLYLLVAQCIAYPFNAKFQIENTPPRTKLNVERFGRIRRILRLALEDYSKLEQMHSTRLSKQEQDVVRKQGFLDSVQWMLEVVFPRPEIKTICEEGGFYLGCGAYLSKNAAGCPFIKRCSKFLKGCP